MIPTFISSLDLENEWFIDPDPRCMSYMDTKLVRVMNIVYEMILSDTNDLNSILLAVEPHMEINKLLNDSTSVVFYRTLVNYVHKLKLNDLLDRQHASELLDKLLKLGPSSKISRFIWFNLIELVLSFDGLVVDRDRQSLTSLINAVRYDDNLEFVYECILDKYDAQHKIEFLWKYYSGFARFGYESEHLRKLLTLFSIIMAQIGDEQLEQIDDWVRELDPSALDLDEPGEQGVVEHWTKNLLLTNLVDLDPQVRLLVARGLGIVSLLNAHLWTVFSDMFIKVGILLLLLVCLDSPE